MDRIKTVPLQDGGQTGLCSLQCAASELNANKDRPVKSILVADRNTRILINAETAIWVMGGKKRGVMTANPKWAFADKAAAEQFIKVNGDRIAGFEEVLKAANDEM